MSEKYDRQVRIWGAHGQIKLQNSKVVLLGCDPAGVETLKNLVLPGVGYIIIVDDKLVTEKDIENNFFIPYNTIGQNRAKVVLEYLLEMNEDVKGEWHEKYDIQKCDLVIANEQECLLTQFNLIQIQTCGFIGRLRIYSPDCHIIETKPMGQKFDLRVFNPFKELQEYFDSMELEGDESYLTHIPYIVLLHKGLQQFRLKYGKNPQTFNEKQNLFKQVLQEVCKKIPFEPGSNVEEAYKNLDQAFEFTEWKDKIEQIEQEPLTQYRIMMKALNNFISIHGVPPLGRAFPDMKCYTQTYVNLKKNIYGKKIESDFLEFKDLCQGQIDDETLRLFIDNVSNLRSINFRTIEEELSTPQQIDNFENDCHVWYILLRAINKFYQVNGHIPNLNDVEKFSEMAQNESKTLSANQIEDKYIQEILRYDGAKLQMIAGVIGGMASQEAVKLITNQFVPINNTLIYDGLKGIAELFEF